MRKSAGLCRVLHRKRAQKVTHGYRAFVWLTSLLCGAAVAVAQLWATPAVRPRVETIIDTTDTGDATLSARGRGAHAAGFDNAGSPLTVQGFTLTVRRQQTVRLGTPFSRRGRGAMSTNTLEQHLGPGWTNGVSGQPAWGTKRQSVRAVNRPGQSRLPQVPRSQHIPSLSG
jgi:hypothetical protein